MSNERIPALRFRQWLNGWNDLKFNEAEHRKKPDPDIFLFSMSAQHLRELCGVYRRSRSSGPPSGIQRGHDVGRSKKIKDYVRNGYPYSDMSVSRRKSFDGEDLRKPGWLPTAIVVNVLTESDERRGKSVDSNDIVRIEAHTQDSFANLILPNSYRKGDWTPSALPPIEVIDGQHRLFAFDEEEIDGEFELPVVCFHGLDIGWQAYLFWSINVSPKKINPSHAYDLYPLLRSQDWLDKFAEFNIYREARAQELTDFLFTSAESPWHNRINMLGEKGQAGITQAAWIRSLTATFLSSGRGRAAKGLFGCPTPGKNEPLAWSRGQQAAFLILVGQELARAVEGTEALEKKESMLAQEQGIRGFLSVCNEFLYAQSEEIGLDAWESLDEVGEITSTREVTDALEDARKQPFVGFVNELAIALSTYDWRSSDAAGLDYEEKLKRRAFRGSSGYSALKQDLLRHLESRKDIFGDLSRDSLRTYKTDRSDAT